MLRSIKSLSVALLLPVMAMAVQKEALIVGVGQYQYGMGQLDLEGIDKDVARMSRLLRKRGFNVRVLEDSEATLQKVRAALKSYQHLSSDDSFFFYSSSHGTQIPDINGDEEDGLDEAYVLYDAQVGNSGVDNMSGLLVDDELQQLLSNIPSKKVMFVDSCHSGTMYKSLNTTYQSKTLKRSPYFPKGEGILGAVPTPKDLVVLAAAGDNQESLASSEGSLFTSAVYDAWSSQPQITFGELSRQSEESIETSCEQSRRQGVNVRTFNPTLYVTNRVYVQTAVDDFLQVNVHVNQERYLIESYLDDLMNRSEIGSIGVSTKSQYQNGERIHFNIDTYGKTGFLYILTVKEDQNNIDVLYPNPYYQQEERWKGEFSFPLANKGFAFEARNNTHNTERTVVYTIFSERKIPELEISRKQGRNHFQSIEKDFTGQNTMVSALKNIVVHKKQNAMAISKQVFNVAP